MECGESLSALALAFIINQPFPAFPIAGCSNLEQLTDNLRAGDLVLEAEQVGWLDEV
jgi:aryl-alcohol dehydrogenase-like predicted oxidoreductase